MQRKDGESEVSSMGLMQLPCFPMSRETRLTAVEVAEMWVWSGDFASLGNIKILDITGLEASTFPN